MKRLLLCLMTLVPVFSSKPCIKLEEIRWRETGIMVEKHPYVTFFAILSVAAIIYWFIRPNPDDLEYERIKAAFARGGMTLIPFHIKRPDNFWKKPIEVEVEL